LGRTERGVSNWRSIQA